MDTSPTETTPHLSAANHRKATAALTVGCIGVVYGDIGTSPLYAMRETLNVVAKDGLTESEVLGSVSLLIWSLIMVVTVKYILFLMRADNRGEGGILSLMALVQERAGRLLPLVYLLSMTGAALFFGDAILTPAISVLSAVEGLKLISPSLTALVVPLTLAILITLFLVQRYGTGKVSRIFGPITLIWFVVMALCAVPHLIAYPTIFLAFMPHHGLQFIIEYKMLSLVVLGAVFLAVTGAEALYADMGHFGKLPIRIAWFSLVFPALILNYLGQGAMILQKPETLENPFFMMAPTWALIPLVILATVATIIASQAVITGAYSMSRQAIQLGLLPRLEIHHTSHTQEGQIYIPQINTLLMIGVVILVIEFKTSGALASAYGIAVSGTMLATTLLAFIVNWKLWGKPLWLASIMALPFVAIDLTFVSANMLRLFDGGYVPLLLGASILIIMWTWRSGSKFLANKIEKDSIPTKDLAQVLRQSSAARVAGTAVFLTGHPNAAPHSLMHNLKHNKVLHETNIILSVRTAPTPRVSGDKRLIVTEQGDGIFLVILYFGYMETPNVPLALTKCRKHGINFDTLRTSYFLGRKSLKISPHSGLPLWQDFIFIMLSRNATNPTEFFHIPPERVVELGTQIAI